MRNVRKLLLSCSILIFIAILSYTIISYMNCTHSDSCSGHILTTALKEGEKEEGTLLWELKYETEVDDIIKNMSTEEYTYPITVDELKSLNYLYCRGHKTYLRGSGTNTITRKGELSGSADGNSYTLEVKTGLEGPLGETEKAEVDSYEYANEDLTYNEKVVDGKRYETTENIYKDKELFVIPGINGDDALINDDHDCNGKDTQYIYNFESVKMDSMSRFKIKKESNGPKAEENQKGEELYTDEDEALYMAYDAAKSYIYTVVKGGHYGIGQLASWRLRDSIGFWQEQAEYEIHDGITAGITSEDKVKEAMGLLENFYQITKIEELKLEVKEDEEHTDEVTDDTYQEETIDYEETLDGGKAGVLYQEALAMARHVYSTETFKDSHNDSLIADCTDKANLNVNYVKSGDYYLVGPFTLEYVRSVMQSKDSPIPEVASEDAFSLGGITGATLTYTRINGETGTLTVDSSASGFEFVVTGNEVPRDFDTAYKFPYPSEEFYLKISYQGTDELTAIKTLDKIEYTLDNTYAKGLVYNLEGRYSVITWGPSGEDECTFDCKEEATVCEDHHTSDSHCSDSCSADGCYGHDDGTSDCDLKVDYDVDDGDDCDGHSWSYTDSDGNEHSGTDYCTGHTSCSDKSLCETHHTEPDTTHARNRAYWIKVTDISILKKSQPLMWMRNAAVYRRTYTATSELNVDMTMDFGGFVWVDAYTQENTDGTYYGDNIYDPSIPGAKNAEEVDKLKQYVEVYLLKKKAEEGTATGDKYEPAYGDGGAKITDEDLYYAKDKSGNKIYAVTDENGEYKFDEIPVLNSNYEGYVVAFVYDGQTYKNVSPLYKQISKKQPISEEARQEYLDSENKYKNFYNSSMAIENEEERAKFNEKFEEFLGKEDINLSTHTTNGQVDSVLDIKTDIDYVEENDGSGRVNSVLRTTKDDGMVEDFYKLESRTSEADLVYPLTDVYNIKVSDKKDIPTLSGTNVTAGGEISFENIETTYGTNQTGYTEHINLGIIYRPQADLSVTKDLYTARTIVKGNDMTYSYGEALRAEESYGYGKLATEGTETWEESRLIQKAISDKKIFYHLYLYKADYDYNSAVEYISQTDDIKKVMMGRYAAQEGSEIVYGTTNSSATLLYNMGRNTDEYKQAEMYDTELRTYLTYKITIRNEGSKSVLAEVNELIDYHDESLQIIDENIYAALIDEETKQLIDSDGNPNKQLVATGSKYYYYKAGQDEAAEVGEVSWTKGSTTAGKAIKSGTSYDKEDEKVNYVEETTDTFKDIRLAKNERIEIYVTYRVKEEARDVYLGENPDPEKDLIIGTNGFGENGKIILGNKYNIAEIGNYSTYLAKDNSLAGRVDKDSAPDNINLADGDKAHYDDDGDAAPPINVDILEGEQEALEVSDNMGTMKEDLQQKYAATRTITGTVWEDSRTSKITEYDSYVGNGIMDENEARIEGITVQLIEIIQTEDGISKEVLLPDIKASDAIAGASVGGDNIDNELGCEYKYETKTDKNGVYTFTNVPTGTYVVRFIYGKDIIKTQYAYNDTEAEDKFGDSKRKVESSAATLEGVENIKVTINNKEKTVTYGLGDEGIVHTFEEMPQTYNGQDYKSTTYQPNVTTNINAEGYVDNEWDSINTQNSGERVSDARDNEVRRLENIAYSRTVNNKVATELDALSTNSTSVLSKYGFSIGIVNGTPQILVEDGTDENGIPKNAQTQYNQIKKINGVESYTISNNENLINQKDLAGVSSYTWMYADTAKINLGLENEMLTEEIMSEYIINSEYNKYYLDETKSGINYGEINAKAYAEDMLKTITHMTRIVAPTGKPTTLDNDTSLENCAYIYNILPGQIQITVDEEVINNFDLDREELEKKFGYSTSGSSGKNAITSYPLVNRIYNVDFGIVERPKTSVELEKWVSSLKLELSDGRILFNIPFEDYYDTDGVLKTRILKEQCTSDVYDASTEEGRTAIVSNLKKLDNTKKVQGFIQVDMDDELLQGATVTVGYKMRVINTSEVDTVGLLSYLDDGDTIMQIANYIKKIAINDEITLDPTIGTASGIGKLLAYFDKVIADADNEISKITASSKTELEKQIEIAKQENVKSRMNNAKHKITELGDKIAKVADYKINNPIKAGTLIDESGSESSVNNIKETTPYGLFLGTTYYTGKASTGSAAVFAVESKVEQIVDYVDNQLGLDEKTIGLVDSSWNKLDLTELFGLYSQSNVLNGANPLDITNEGTLINIFESAVINISEDIVELINEKLLSEEEKNTDGEIKLNRTSVSEMNKEYRRVYEKLLSVAGKDIKLEELVNSLGDEGVRALIKLYNDLSTSKEGTELKEMLEKIISGLTITDKDGNSYITIELKDDENELRNNVVISTNDPTINVDLANYLVPKAVNELSNDNFGGTNSGLTDDINKLYQAEINLIAQKTISATALNSEIDNMVFNNAAEIVQISNKVGRKDKMAVAGNLLIGEGEWESTTGYDPDDGKEITERLTIGGSIPISAEYDAAATARIIFTPPTGSGIARIINSDIFQGGLIGLIVLAVGIIAIKLAFFKKKKIYK